MFLTVASLVLASGLAAAPTDTSTVEPSAPGVAVIPTASPEAETIAAQDRSASRDLEAYTNSARPSRNEGLQSGRGFVPAADPRGGRLITPEPFPARRIDDVDRMENGRLWFARSPIGNRTPVRELVRGEPGPGSVGAAGNRLDDLIFVQTDARLPVVAISPWVRDDDRTFKQIERQVPFVLEGQAGTFRLVATRNREGEIKQELKAARNQWLREQGYIAKVRTHVNPALIAGLDASHSAQGQARPAASEIQPRAVIRVVPQPQGTPDIRAQAPAAE